MNLLDEVLGGVVGSSDLAAKLGKPEADLRAALDATEKAVHAWRQVLASAEPILESYGVKIQK